jgi:hypothetical protein
MAGEDRFCWFRYAWGRLPSPPRHAGDGSILLSPASTIACHCSGVFATRGRVKNLFVPIKDKGKPLYGLFSTDFARIACTSFESQPTGKGRTLSVNKGIPLSKSFLDKVIPLLYDKG